MTTYLPDVNVWIAMAVDGHLHHAAAKRWFDDVQSERLAFCRVTEMGLMRLLTNDRVMGGNALTAAEAWKVRDQFQNDPRLGFIREPPGFDVARRKSSRAGKIGPNFWTDAYLVCLCAAADCTLITFDRKLGSAKECKARILAGE